MADTKFVLVKVPTFVQSMRFVQGEERRLCQGSLPCQWSPGPKMGKNHILSSKYQ